MRCFLINRRSHTLFVQSIVNLIPFVTSFIRKSINHGYKPTIGADFNSKKLQMPVGDEMVTVTLQLWDTAGQERY